MRFETGSAVDFMDDFFDEAYYRATYNYAGSCAYCDYLQVGIPLHRNPNAWFDEEAYRTHPDNGDIATALALGWMTSGWEHYLRFGAREGRPVIAGFDEKRYLSMYFDVYQAVLYNPGVIFSGLHHWKKYGQTEGRNGQP